MVDTAGNEIWSKEYEVAGGQGLWGVVGLDNGMIVSCGVTDGASGSQAGWLIKTDANGDTIWTRTFDEGIGTDYLRNMMVMDNGDIVMVGFGRGENSTSQDGWILRVDSMGCVVENCFSVGVDELEVAEPSVSVYPNPNQGTFTVQVLLAATDEATMEVYNISGQLVYSKRLYPGSNRLQLNVADGLYLYRVMVNREPKWLGKISIGSE
jgi:hypothetical protein